LQHIDVVLFPFGELDDLGLEVVRGDLVLVRVDPVEVFQNASGFWRYTQRPAMEAIFAQG